jgi:ABC-2 type transport system permease protein
LQVLVFLLVGKVLGLDIASNIFLYLLVIEVYIVLFTSIGLSIGMVFSSSRSAQLTSVTLVTALLILSGTIIPHSMFPDWLGIFSKNLPTTRLVVSLQGVSMLDFTIDKVFWPVFVSLFISISLIFLSSFMYSRESITMAE